MGRTVILQLAVSKDTLTQTLALSGNLATHPTFLRILDTESLVYSQIVVVHSIYY